MLFLGDTNVARAPSELKLFSLLQSHSRNSSRWLHNAYANFAIPCDPHSLRPTTDYGGCIGGELVEATYWNAQTRNSTRIRRRHATSTFDWLDALAKLPDGCMRPRSPVLQAFYTCFSAYNSSNRRRARWKSTHPLRVCQTLDLIEADEHILLFHHYQPFRSYMVLISKSRTRRGIWKPRGRKSGQASYLVSPTGYSCNENSALGKVSRRHKASVSLSGGDRFVLRAKLAGF